MQFGLRGIYLTPYPHFSYQVAQGYNVNTLEPILKRIAQTTAPFQVRAAGLGIFTGKSPVLYIPVVRNPALTQFHHAVWSEISGSGSGVVSYYHPENWLPHITIGFGDLHSGNLSGVIRLLAEREIDWEITVNNLAYIEDTGQAQQLRFEFNFSG
jgi:2'-5' RNA ligase